jgi:hypothetical protein
MPPALVTKPLGRLTPSVPRRRRFSFAAPREISLVGASLRALTSGRLGCARCRRTPLVGEVVLVEGERVLCALCRPAGHAGGQEAVVHSAERGQTVRRRL